MSQHRARPGAFFLANSMSIVLSGALIATAVVCTSRASGAQSVAPGAEWFRDGPARVPGDPPAGPVADAPAPAAAPDAAAVAPDPQPAQAPQPAAPVTIPPQAPNPAAEPPIRPSFPGNYPAGAGGYPPYGLGNSDYPAGPVYGVVVAQARAATALAIFRRAETELSLTFRNAQHDFEESQAFRDAIRDEKIAYDELGRARRKTFQSLQTDMQYQRLAALRQDLSDHLAQRRAAHDVAMDEVIAIATLKMSYAVDMRTMEAALLNADGAEVKAAQDRLVAVGSRVAALRHQYDESLRTNPQVVAARRNLGDARIAKISADAYLNAMANAGQAALDYAYYLHSRRGGVYADYDGSGYAGGYGLRY